MEQKTKSFTAVFSVIVLLMLCASIALSVITFKTVNNTAKAFNTAFGTNEDVASEDDVLIANTYLVKSTKMISDAYISGDVSQLSDRDKETLDLAKSVIDSVIKPGMSDYEKEKEIYIYLTTKLKSTNGILTVINTNVENFEPHDVLKNKSAVCVGYATTFRLFMQMLNIECKVVHSTDLSHTWNLVKLDDGWYHTDCYSDADSSLFANFNMDDDYCAVNHNWNRTFFPAANGKKYNYILLNSKKLKNIYAIPDYTAKMISKKETVIACTFDRIDEKEQTAANYMVESLQTNLNDDKRSVTCQWVSTADGGYALVISVMYSENYVDSETGEKIDNSVFEAIDKYGLNQ